MPAWDNVQLPSPPNGPAYITAGLNTFNTMANQVGQLGTSYQQGQDFAYQQNQRNFFQDPNNLAALSTFLNQPSQQNYAALMQKMLPATGIQGAGPLIDQYLGMTQDQNIARQIGGGQTNAGPASSSVASGPDNIQPNYSTQSSPQARIPYATPSSLGTDNEGGQSIDQLAAERHIDLHDFLSAYPGFQRLVGNDALTPGQVQQITKRMATFADAGSANPVPQSGNGDQEGQNAAASNQLRPSMGESSSAMSPRQTAGQGRAPQAPPGPLAGDTFQDRFGASYGNPPTRPSPIGDQAKIDAMNVRIQQLRAMAAAYARRSPGAAQQADKAADDLVKERDKIIESISKYNEPGRTQRDVESGATKAAEQIKSDTERYGKQYDAYQNRADQARQLVSTNSITKSIMDDPNFYSGSGAEHVLLMKRIGVALGLTGEAAAAPMEVFHKTVSSAILDQIRSLGGQGLGQVRVAEINVMKQAAQNAENTPASNRMLTEMQDRLAEKWTIPIAEAAQQYKGGHLDAGFDQWKTQYINSHPLFSKEELADPRRIAPPLARTPADLSKIGWKDGDPFRTPDGRIFTHAPPGFVPARKLPSYNPNGA